MHDSLTSIFQMQKVKPGPDLNWISTAQTTNMKAATEAQFVSFTGLLCAQNNKCLITA